MSIIFNTEESAHVAAGLPFQSCHSQPNGLIEVEPHPVGDRRWLDVAKSGMVMLRDKLAQGLSQRG